MFHGKWLLMQQKFNFDFFFHHLRYNDGMKVCISNPQRKTWFTNKCINLYSERTPSPPLSLFAFVFAYIALLDVSTILNRFKPHGITTITWKSDDVWLDETTKSSWQLIPFCLNRNSLAQQMKPFELTKTTLYLLFCVFHCQHYALNQLILYPPTSTSLCFKSSKPILLSFNSSTKWLLST